MRLSTREQRHVCLPCLLKYGQRALSTISGEAGYAAKPPDPSSAYPLRIRRTPTSRPRAAAQLASTRHTQSSFDGGSRANSSVSTSQIELSPEQLREVEDLNRLRHRLATHVSRIPGYDSKEKVQGGLTIEEALKALPTVEGAEAQDRVVHTLRKAYAGKSYRDVNVDITKVTRHRRPAQRIVYDESTRQILTNLDITSATENHQSANVRGQQDDQSQSPPASSSTEDPNTTASGASNEVTIAEGKHPDPHHATKTSPPRSAGRIVASGRRRRGAVVRTHPSELPSDTLKNESTARPQNSSESKSISPTAVKPQVSNLKTDLLKIIAAEDSTLRALPAEHPKVPGLSFDLTRVLFNPGVYQLQDPRSRVFNFDPYLAQIMPVQDFNFDALGKYITSSEDDVLKGMAKRHGKRYIGSTSSMSSALSQFHFLLSSWRGICVDMLSKGFSVDIHQFTKIQRAPSAIFLRWKGGVYAVDADKEYDSANILMSLGRSMEKLLTREKDEFELYRKSSVSDQNPDAPEMTGEAYHYSEIGQFLLRSQLDAYDSRLPGTGMFDLKTRAVAGIRLQVRDYEQGKGYQIKDRYGEWESYEREYFDMIRSAFLKYSLQVRMGRMDGIFVAYHNVERIFGFQYVALPELDLALHGQTDRALGDQEFGLSVKLLDEIFDHITSRFPETSLRMHFETREPSQATPAPYMYVFGEPVTEEEAQRIQESKKEEIEAIEQRLLNRQSEPAIQAIEDVAAESDTDRDDAGEEDGSDSEMDASNAADVNFLDSITKLDLDSSQTTTAATRAQSESKPKQGPLIGFRLRVRNRVNGEAVVRPEQLTQKDAWLLEYNLEEMSEEEARRKYTLCKNRRHSTLTGAQMQDAAVSYYIRRLREISEKGAAWRKQQDALDAERETVVLYGDNVSVGSSPS